jgi:predicted secreted hydrolase
MNVIRALVVGFFLVLPSIARAESSQPSLTFAKPGYEWSFPRDHGPHPAYQTEWWYFTGQLYSESAVPFVGKPLYGFQLTFFRRSQTNTSGVTSEFLAHAAITDLKSGETHHASRTGGGLLGVAGACEGGLEVWSGDWSAEVIGDVPVLRFDIPDRKTGVRLVGENGFSPWLQGERGFSKKGSCDACASQYYSVPRLQFKGEVRVGDTAVKVRGLGWMDHEFMTNSLQEDQVGWDWLGLMLKDGRSLTVFRLRDARGNASFMSATLLKDGLSIPIPASELTFAPIEAPVAGGVYPLRWLVQIPSQNVDASVVARAPQCEVGGGDGSAPRYWEGPVATADESAVGYLEMTGYKGKVTI